MAGQPGLGVDGARYLAELGVVAVGAEYLGAGSVARRSGRRAVSRAP